MLYSGGTTTREQLRTIPVPEKFDHWQPKHWAPIQHGQLADTIVQQAKKQGFSVVSECWETTVRDLRLFGSLDLKPGKDLRERLGLKLNEFEGVFSLGVRHSNDGVYALTFAVGAKVSVCSNGLMSGEFCLRKRHSKDMDLPSIVADGISRYAAEASEIDKFVKAMKEEEVPDSMASDILLQSSRDGIIPWTHLRDLDALYRTPNHPEFKDRNAWSLYNAYTEFAQRYNPDRQMRILGALRTNIFKNVFSAEAPSEPEPDSEDVEG